MDGPTSRLPSTVTNPDLSLAHAVTARRSLRELYASAPVTPSSYVDPPRPPKAGCEWVWFPGGYWAEREVVEAPGREFIKAFKWRKRSGKGSSSRETTTNNHLPDSREQSPSESYEQQASRMPFPSPFLTEEAHVQSLQRPSMPRHGNSSDSVSSLWLNRLPRPPLPSPYLTEEAHVLSLQRPPAMYQNSNSNDSGSSMLKMMRTLPSSPLTQSKQNSDCVTPMTGSIDEPFEEATMEPATPTSSGQLKTKRSLINRLLSPESKSPKQPKRPSPIESCGASSSDSYMTARAAVVVVTPPPPPPPPSHSTPIGRVAALLRDESHRRPRKARSMRIFSKSSWHRKASAGSETSASSSVRDMLRGKTPTVSPDPDEGPGFGMFVVIAVVVVVISISSGDEPCNSWSAQYPGGEATRVKTPPLRQCVADQRPRSFFFDISSPPPPPPDQDQPSAQVATTSDGGGNESGPSPTPGRQRRTHQHAVGPQKPAPQTAPTTRKARTTISSSSAASAPISTPAGAANTSKPKPKTKSKKKKKTTEPCNKEWWEVPAPVRPSHQQHAHLSPSSYAAMAAAAAFEFDVPEHLPSSPMCPANKRHRSGGTGVCVYHGRRKRSSNGGHGGGGGGLEGGVEVGSANRSDVEDGCEEGDHDDAEDDFWT
ncbi:hypothetical protein F4775DRAFT_602031 [Biscogniauxia sp. FL1348]|nr:hypothetical protein F4775DRAFT_602031 [Biscogniauxia sp. FL1348]